MKSTFIEKNTGNRSSWVECQLRGAGQSQATERALCGRINSFDDGILPEIGELTNLRRMDMSKCELSRCVTMSPGWWTGSFINSFTPELPSTTAKGYQRSQVHCWPSCIGSGDTELKTKIYVFIGRYIRALTMVKVNLWLCDDKEDAWACVR